MFKAYIDNSGILQAKYKDAQQLNRYVFVVCTRGECKVSLYTSVYTLKENSIITLLPYKYFRVIEQQADTELYVVTFDKRTFTSADVFETIIEHVAHIMESPFIDFPPTSIEVICDYIRVLMRMKEELLVDENSDFVCSVLKQIIVIIGARYNKLERVSQQKDRSKALVFRLTKLIAVNYKSERSATFYARAMHVSPQHLASVVKRVTDKTITDIIAIFVMLYAQTKLVSTDLSIGEIAADLNFDDISVFGRYFKRYTKLSPRQYRTQNGV